MEALTITRRALSASSLVATVVLCAWSPVHAQTAKEIQEDRAAALQIMLTDYPAQRVAMQRTSCIAGRQPDFIRETRATGADVTPDASDLCASVLMRMARDGTLLQPYQALFSTQTGGSTGYESIPAAMATAALKNGADRIAVGNGKAVMLTSAWMLDAGFTVAYQQRPAPPASMPPIAALKPIAERCLGRQERDLSLCYSTGYMYGLRAVNGTLLTALRQALQQP